MPSKMDLRHPAGLAHVLKRPLEQFRSTPQQAALRSIFRRDTGEDYAWGAAGAARSLPDRLSRRLARAR